MEVGTATALTLYSFQAAQKGGSSTSSLVADALPVPQGTIGGMGTATLSALLSGSRSQSTPSDQDGYSSSLSLNSALVLTAYSAKQNGLSTTVNAAANASVASLDPTDPFSVQNAIQSAQSSFLTNTLDLFG